MATFNKAILLPDYKKINGIDRLDIFISKKTGKKYATHPDGTFVGMLSDDLDKAKPMAVITVTNEDTGETWNFIGNSERTAVETL